MFVDASALTAMIVDEHDAATLLAVLLDQKVRMTSPLSIWEAAVAIGRILQTDVGTAENTLRRFVTDMGIDIAPASADIGSLAISAYAAYGKSRHRAALNFGDCFSYAYAKHHGLPLLYKGDDFALTDLAR